MTANTARLLTFEGLKRKERFEAEARALHNSHARAAAQEWWSRHSRDIFERIESAASHGVSAIKVPVYHTRNEHWHLGEIAVNNLSPLGFQVDFSDCYGAGYYLFIQW